MSSRHLLGIDALNPAINTVSRALDSWGCKDVTLSLHSSPSTSAGQVQLEGSPTGSTAAEPSQKDWVAIGSPLAFGVADTTVAQSVVAAHRYVRLRVSTAFLSGVTTNTRAYVTLCGASEGAWN